MVAVSNGLVCDANCAAFEHCVEQFAVRGEVEVGEQNLALADQLVFGFDRLLYLDDHVGYAIDFLDGGQDGCAGCDILFIRESAAFACCVLYIQCVAVTYKFLDARRCATHAVFVVLNLFWNSDFHNILDFKVDFIGSSVDCRLFGNHRLWFSPQIYIFLFKLQNVRIMLLNIISGRLLLIPVRRTLYYRGRPYADALTGNNLPI